MLGQKIDLIGGLWVEWLTFYSTFFVAMSHLHCRPPWI